MKQNHSTLSQVLMITGLLFAGYVLVTSLPEIRRYIRISTM